MHLNEDTIFEQINKEFTLRGINTGYFEAKDKATIVNQY